MPECIMEVFDAIELEPFIHQVGGHSCMLKYDENTVCKPLIPRELLFYESMPPELKMFAPQYRGTVSVVVQEDTDGYLSLMAGAVGSSKSRQSTSSLQSKRKSGVDSHSSSGGEENRSDSDSESHPTKQRFRIQKSGNIEIEGIPELEDRDIGGSTEILYTTGHKPWRLSSHKEHLAKMHKSFQDTNKAHKFILLENLASKYELPCILDLKMGQRQHGDDAPESKRLSQMKKCQNTTSAKMGVRVCGMQVYQRDKSNFLCHNKYYGRKLDEKGVRRCLEQFLHNGCRLRLDLIDPIISKLKQLYDIIKKQPTYRFYSSSLLIMYEGHEVDLDMMDIESSGGSEFTNKDESNSSTSSSNHVNCVHKQLEEEQDQHSCDIRGENTGEHNNTEEKCDICKKNSSNEELTTARINAETSASVNVNPEEKASTSSGESHDAYTVKKQSAVTTMTDNIPKIIDNLHISSPCSDYIDVDDDATSSSLSNSSSTYKQTLQQRSIHSTYNTRINGTHTTPSDQVDIRMIDFAHSTFQGFSQDKTKHEGCDHGYLFGLSNLIDLFTRIQDQYKT